MNYFKSSNEAASKMSIPLLGAIVGLIFLVMALGGWRFSQQVVILSLLAAGCSPSFAFQYMK
jgi:hypothetical protein